MDNFIIGVVVGFAGAVMFVMLVFGLLIMPRKRKDYPTKDEWRMK